MKSGKINIRKSPIGVGIVFVVIGMFMLCVLFGTIVQVNGDNVLQIDGTIVDYEYSRSTGSWRAIYEYEIDGEIYRYVDIDNARHAGGVGRTVKLYYDAESQMVTPISRIVNQTIICAGVLAIGIAIIVFSKYYIEKMAILK